MKKKYIFIILIFLLSVICTVGGSTWIILKEQTAPPKEFTEDDKFTTEINVSDITEYFAKAENKIYYGEDVDQTIKDKAKVLTPAVDKDGNVIKEENGEIKYIDISSFGTFSLTESTTTLKGEGDSETDVTATTSISFTLGEDYKYVYKIPLNVTINVPMYAVAYIKDGKYYSTIDQALEAASSGNTITVMPSDYETETEAKRANAKTVGVTGANDLEVKSGVTLSLPWATSSTDTSSYAKSSKAKVNDITILALTTSKSGGELAFQKESTYLVNKITLNKSLTNNGTINVGGVIAAGQSKKNSCTFGKYAQITLKSNVTLTNEDSLNCYGYIIEETDNNNGIVNNKSLEIPFSMVEQRGGTNFNNMRSGLEKAYTDEKGSTAPFNRFFLANIFSNLRNNYGSTIQGFTDLYAGSQHNETIISLIGPSSSYLIDTSSNGESTGTVVKAKCSSSTLINQIDICGSFNLNDLSIKLSIKFIVSIDVELTTKNVLFPISWYFNVNLNKFESGADSTVKLNQNIKLLPGAKLTINKGVTVNADYLTVYDTFPASTDPCAAQVFYPEKPSDGKFYQYDEKYNIPAELTVNGTLNANTLGGEVKTATNGACLNVTTSNSALARELNTTDPTYTNDNYKSLTLPMYGSDTTTLNTSADIGTYYSKDGAWFKNTATITYKNESGKTLSTKDVTLTANGYTLSESDLTAEKDHYTFNGYYYTKNGVETKATTSTVIYGDIELTQKWTVNAYTLKYKYVLPDGTVTESGIADTPFTINSKLSPPTNYTAPTDEDGSPYNFGGWYTAAKDGTQINSINVSEFADSAFANNNEITIYAIWVGDPVYIVTFNNPLQSENGDGDYDILVSTEVTDKGDDTVFTLPTSTLKGTTFANIKDDPTKSYYFDGWYVDSGFDTPYESWKQLKALSSDGKNCTLYAHWITKFVLSFNMNIEESGNITEIEIPSVYLYAGQKYDLSQLTETMSQYDYDVEKDHSFNGWKDITDDEISINANTDLVVNWLEKCKVTIGELGNYCDKLSITFSNSNHKNIPTEFKKKDLFFYIKKGEKITVKATAQSYKVVFVTWYRVIKLSITNRDTINNDEGARPNQTLSSGEFSVDDHITISVEDG